eukprot:4114047-Pleurochrysis_carterae.AAC.2
MSFAHDLSAHPDAKSIRDAQFSKLQHGELRVHLYERSPRLFKPFSLNAGNWPCTTCSRT